MSKKEKKPWFEEFRGFRYMGGCGTLLRNNLVSIWKTFRGFKLTDEVVPFPRVVENWGFENTPEGLRRARRYFTVILLCCTFFACFAAANLMFGIESNNMARVFGNGVFLLTSLLVVWVTAWRRDIIVNKRHVPLRRWIMKLKPWTACFLILICLSCVSRQFQSYAAEFDLPKQVALEKTNDISADIFSAIFGQAWETVTGHSVVNGLPVSYQGLFPKIIEMLNYAVLVYVCVFMFYIWVMFAVAGAEKGGAANNSKANMWKVFRQVFTVGFSVPVLHGFSMFQVFIIGAISLGINFANIIWDGTTTFLVDNAGQNITIAPPPVVEFQATNLAQTMFEQATRQAYGRQTQRYTGASADLDCPMSSSSKRLEGDMAQGYVMFEESNGAQNLLIYGPTDSIMCSGALRLRAEPVAKGISKDTALKIAKAKIELARDMWVKMLPFGNYYILNYKALNGNSIIETPNASIGSSNSFPLQDMLKTYRTKVIQLGNEMVNGNSGSAFKEQMRAALGLPQGGSASDSLGWAISGLFSYTIASVQRDVESILASDVTITYGYIATSVVGEYADVEALTSYTGDATRQVDVNGKEDLSFFERMAIALGFGDRTTTDVAACFAESSKYFVRNVLQNTSMFEESSSLSRPIFYIFFGGSGKSASYDNKGNITGTGTSSNVNMETQGLISAMLATLSNNDPILALVTMGVRMLYAGFFLMGILAVGKATAATGLLTSLAVANPIGSAVGATVQAVMTTLGDVAYLLCGAFLMGGLLLTYILPMIPAIFWIRALLSWVYLVLESVVAAAFWIVSHMMPDEGVGFISSAARRGYMLLVDIVIRPPLLVVGVVFSLILIRIFGVFSAKLLSIFFNTLGDTKEFNSLSMLDQLVFGFLVAYFLYTICYTIFIKGVNHLPLNISRWVGGSSLSLGEENESTSFANAGRAFQQGSSQISQMLYRRQGGGGGKDKNQNKDKGGTKN